MATTTSADLERLRMIYTGWRILQHDVERVSGPRYITYVATHRDTGEVETSDSLAELEMQLRNACA